MQGGSGLARHWFRGRLQASALPLGGLGPAAKSVREGFQRRWLVRRSSASQGGISLTMGETSAQNRPRPVAGWADAPLPGAAPQGAPILPGGQWRPGFGRESSGRPGRHPPLDGCRLAELPTALPGGERRLGTGHETNGGPSRSPPGPRAFCGRPAPSGQVGPHGGTSPPMCPPALRGGFQFPQPEGRRKLCACGGHPAPGQSLATFF